jgi:hypothetical protein
MYKVLFFFFISLSASQAQITDLRGGGATILGLGRYRNVNFGEGALYGNLSSLVKSDYRNIWDVGASIRYSDANLGEYNIAFMHRNNSNSISSINFVQFGTTGYFERKIQASYARRLANNFDFGLSFNFNHLVTSEFGSTITPSVDLYGHYSASKKILFDLLVKNVVSTSDIDGLAYPRMYALSTMYVPSNNTRIGLEYTSILNIPDDLKLVVSYLPIETLRMNLGIDVFTQSYSIGLSFGFENYRFGTAMGSHNRLAPSFGLSGSRFDLIKTDK